MVSTQTGSGKSGAPSKKIESKGPVKSAAPAKEQTASAKKPSEAVKKAEAVKIQEKPLVKEPPKKEIPPVKEPPKVVKETPKEAVKTEPPKKEAAPIAPKKEPQKAIEPKVKELAKAQEKPAVKPKDETPKPTAQPKETAKPEEIAKPQPTAKTEPVKAAKTESAKTAETSKAATTKKETPKSENAQNNSSAIENKITALKADKNADNRIAEIMASNKGLTNSGSKETANIEQAINALSGSSKTAANNDMTSDLNNDGFAALVENHVRQNWSFPVMKDKKLVATVAFTVKADGTINNVALKKSSGNSFYDRTVLSAVMKSAPMPLPPNPQEEVEINFYP
ncbi:TonB-like protein [Candidatus Magnetoovum chiemensis]|nr:TonB-like protein [Candidatus Magnetoovum chiemensis]